MISEKYITKSMPNPTEYKIITGNSKPKGSKMHDAGLEINEKFQSQFCDRMPKFSRNLATFSRRIFARLFALHFPVSGLAKQNMSPQFLCVVTFLFRKSRGKISRKFATSPDILVAKGKN